MSSNAPRYRVIKEESGYADWLELLVGDIIIEIEPPKGFKAKGRKENTGEEGILN